MKKILISLLSIIFIISMITIVYAATGNISSGSSADTVYKGKTFTVTLTGTADSPIDGMKTKISYDKSILSLESSTPGTNYGNNSSEGEILVTSNADTSPTSATLYTMTFKVLDGTNAESATISFSDSELHLTTEETIEKFSTTIDEVVVNIKKDDTTVGNQGGTNEDTETPEDGDGTGAGTQTPEDDGNTPSNDDNNNGGNADGNNSNSGNENKNTNKNVNSNKNTNKNTTKLPQTGAESASVIAIIALGTIAIASYVSYRRYKNI